MGLVGGAGRRGDAAWGDERRWLGLGADMARAQALTKPNRPQGGSETGLLRDGWGTGQVSALALRTAV